MAVKFKKGYVVDSKNNNISTLAEANAEEAKCGCGIVCNDCHSFLELWNYNSETGARTKIAVYVVDGALTLGEVDEVKAEQKGYTELA